MTSHNRIHFHKCHTRRYTHSASCFYHRHLIFFPFVLQVSATFAASLVTSPAIGAYLEIYYSDTLVVALATAVAVLDVVFILCFVPESLPDKLRTTHWGSNFSWEKADPFGVSFSKCTVFFRASAPSWK